MVDISSALVSALRAKGYAVVPLTANSMPIFSAVADFGAAYADQRSGGAVVNGYKTLIEKIALK